MANPTTIATFPLSPSRAYRIPFEYLARRFVVVALVSQADKRVLLHGTDYRFTGRTTIETSRQWSEADGYQYMEISRMTSATERLVDFNDGSVLRANDLNVSQVQSLHIAEEGRDAASFNMSPDRDGNFDARQRRIVGLADGVDIDDAVTMGQVGAWLGAYEMNWRFLAPSAGPMFPTRRDNGATLEVGDMWFNTTSMVSYRWTGSQWTTQAIDAQLLASPDGASAVFYMKRSLAEIMDDTVNARNYIETPVDGTTSNQAGLVAAYAKAYQTGKDLVLPAGQYVSTDNIPYLHQVRTIGTGAITRNGTTFRFGMRGKVALTNSLYVAIGGDQFADGLTPDAPLPSPQSAFDALSNVEGMLYGRWIVNIGPGTWNEGSTLDGVVSRRRIEVVGSSAKNSVISGANGVALNALNGMSLLNGVYAQIKNLVFTDWIGASGVGSGSANAGVGTDSANVWVDDCDFVRCGTAVAATRSRIYHGRGTVAQCSIGSTAFASTQCSYGYGGPTTYIGCDVGCNIRDSSSGVVDAGIFTNCNIGVRVQYGSVARISNSKFSGTVTADVYCYTGGSVFFGEGNVHTARKFRGQNSLDLARAGQIYFDGDAGPTGRFNFGGVITPNYKFHFREETQNAFASTSGLMCIEAPNAQISFNGALTGFHGFQFAVPGFSQEASLLYSHNDGTWRIRCNNVDSYRMHPTTLRPAVDNASMLGHPSTRWTVVHAVTGTINVSDERHKENIEIISEILMDAWQKVELMTFLYKDAVEEKGIDGARIHFGVIAQRVETAFRSVGLDPFKLGILCYDEWEATPIIRDDKSGEIIDAGRPSGNRYGVRYEEALILEAAVSRRRADRVEKRLAALEAKLFV